MQRGFGLISLLIALAIVAGLGGFMLQGYFRASMEPSSPVSGQGC
jgi:type II secretory pathway pseudopilin PulG